MEAKPASETMISQANGILVLDQTARDSVKMTEKQIATAIKALSASWK